MAAKSGKKTYDLFSKGKFAWVTDNEDEKKLITQGNKRVVEARLSDAKFFWDKDRSKNLIKQIIL